MPISNGTYTPWQTPVINASQGFTGIVNTVQINLPWLFPTFFFASYIVFMVMFAGIPGRKKYITITFTEMVIGMVLELTSFIPPVIAAAAGGIFLITTIIVIGSGG